jgi:hypothetical protein
MASKRKIDLLHYVFISVSTSDDDGDNGPVSNLLRPVGFPVLALAKIGYRVNIPYILDFYIDIIFV